MNKFVKILAGILAITLLSACAPNPYQVINEDGQYYIVINQKESAPKNTNKTVYEGSEQPYIVFESVDEMKNDILSGNYSEEEWGALIRLSKFSYFDGKIPICNLDTLCEPVFPTMYDSYTIRWTGVDYSFKLLDADEKDVRVVVVLSKDEYDKKVERWRNWQDYIDTGIYDEEIDLQIDSEQNAALYSYTYWYFNTNGYGNALHEAQKDYIYLFEANGNVYYVFEHYAENTSANVPEYVQIYGKSNDMYFWIAIFDPLERPSREWISSFGLVPYQESGAAS